MTMIKKKFEKIEDGINNMLDAAAYDYSKNGFKHRTSDEFRSKFMVKVGQKYIKIGRKSDYNGKMGQVWAFVVNTDNDKKFKKGDIIFWKGHVAICINTNDLIHAYGPKKRVIIMPIKKTIKLIKETAKLDVKKVTRI